MKNNIEVNKSMGEIKFYQQTWFVWVTLIILAPIGIFLMWRYNKFNELTRVFLTMVFAIVFLALVLAMGDMNGIQIKHDVYGIITLIK